MLGPVLTIGGLAAATVALHLRDPHVSHSWGVCPLYALTGIYCPGCGGLRGVNDLTDGHLGAAASSNLLLVVAIPFAVLVLARWTWVSVAGQRRDRRAGAAARGQDRPGRRGAGRSGSPATCPGAGSPPDRRSVAAAAEAERARREQDDVEHHQARSRRSRGSRPPWPCRRGGPPPGPDGPRMIAAMPSRPAAEAGRGCRRPAPRCPCCCSAPRAHRRREIRRTATAAAEVRRSSWRSPAVGGHRAVTLRARP